MSNPFFKSPTPTPTPTAVPTPTAAPTVVPTPTAVPTTTDDSNVKASKRKKTGKYAAQKKMDREDEVFILKNFVNMTNSQIAKARGLTDQQVSGFFAKKKKELQRIIDDPEVDQQSKQNAIARLQYINQERHGVSTSTVGKKKATSEIAAEIDDLFNGLV